MGSAHDLPVANGDKIAQGFEQLGWKRRRGGRNHIILTHPERPGVELSIPDHKEVDRYLLHAHVVKHAGLTVEQYNAAFEQIGKAKQSAKPAAPELGDEQPCPKCQGTMFLGYAPASAVDMEWVCLECSHRVRL